jgi:hypothetical protein
MVEILADARISFESCVVAQIPQLPIVMLRTNKPIPAAVTLDFMVWSIARPLEVVGFSGEEPLHVVKVVNIALNT